MTTRTPSKRLRQALIAVLAFGFISFPSVLAKSNVHHSGVAAGITVTVRPRLAADLDAERLALALAPGTDLQPTGLYLPPERKVSVSLKVHSASGSLPSISVGAPYASLDPKSDDAADWWQRTLETRPTALREGSNTISDPYGGPIYITWPSKRPSSRGVASITFGAGTRAMATFTLGKTPPQAFRKRLEQRTAPFVELYGERSMLTLQRTQALNFRNENPRALMSTLDRIIATEDRLAGYGSGGPKNVGPAAPHHLIGYPGDIPDVGAFAQSYSTVYPEPIHDYLLDVSGLRTDGWGAYHELGHQHQQEAVTPSDLVEVTVNLYSLAVQRAFTRAYGQIPRLRAVNSGGTSYWDDAMAAQKAGIAAFRDLDVFVQLIPFEQLRLAYGERMLTSWHKLVRRQNFPAGSNENEADKLRWQNMVLSTSMAASTDLSGFWADWGVSVTEGAVDAITRLNLKPPTQELTRLREPNVTGPDTP